MHEEFALSSLKPQENKGKDEILSKLRKKRLALDNAYELAQIEAQHSLDYLFEETNSEE